MHDHGGLRVVEERGRLATDALRDLSRRLDGYRKSADLGAAWDRGVPRGWLDALLEDWRVFDTDALQLRLDALPQQRAEVAGIALHVVHAEGCGPSPLPLLLTHGWPGSFLEYLPILPLLCDPGAHGADHFVAHGSDLGAGVTAWLARDHPEAVAAIHLATPGLAVAPGPRTEHEEDFARAVGEWTAEEGGWAEHPTGGHFPAVAEPELLARTLRDAFRPMRSRA